MAGLIPMNNLGHIGGSSFDLAWEKEAHTRRGPENASNNPMFTAESADKPSVPKDETQHSDSAKIWSMYLSHAEKFDKGLAESWKGDMDAQLIFAGLFSAVITAFLIESQKQLQCDVSEPYTQLLLQIAADITGLNQTTLEHNACDPPNSVFSTAVARSVNALWFLSLVFSLSCALAATLVQQWSRAYLQGTGLRTVPHERARSRTYFFEGVSRYRVTTVVEAIPMLLHAALFLFFAGLVVFLFPLDHAVAIPVLIVVAIFSIAYVSLTIMPAFDFACPYKTPLSSFIWYMQLGRHVRSLRKQDQDAGIANYQSRLAVISLSRPYDEDVHLAKSDLDPKALHWTMQWLANDSELEPFVAAIPELLQPGQKARENLDTVQKLFFGSEMQAKRIAGLLATCRSSPGLTSSDRERRVRKAVACLNVIIMVPNPGVRHVTSPELWPAFVVQYFQPIVREITSLKEDSEPSEEVRDLAHRTFVVLAWRAIVNYRAYLYEVKRITDNYFTTKQKHHDAYRAALQHICYGEYLEGPLKDLLSSTHYELEEGSMLTDKLRSLTAPDTRISAKLQRLKDSVVKTLDHQAVYHDSKALQELALQQLVQIKGCLSDFVLFHINNLMKVHAEKEGGIRKEKYDIISDTLRSITSSVSWAETISDVDKQSLERTLRKAIPHDISSTDPNVLPLPLPFLHIIIPFFEDMFNMSFSTSLTSIATSSDVVDPQRLMIQNRLDNFYAVYPDKSRAGRLPMTTGRLGDGHANSRRDANVSEQSGVSSLRRHNRASVSMIPPTRQQSPSTP